MEKLLEQMNLVKSNKKTFTISLIFLIFGIVSFLWQFWLISGIIIFLLLFIYFSENLHNIFNIHLVALSLIVIHALPSIILILQGEISLDNDEILTLLSSIVISLIAYTCGTIFFKKIFSFEKIQNTAFSKKLNDLFWLAYKYRFVLLVISVIVLLIYGFMPMFMPYKESIKYRMEVPGVIQYLNSLIPTVFSVLTVAMISIVGDVNRQRKLSFLSYLLIALVIVSIIGGHRIWIIALFACLMIAFQPYLKRRDVLMIVILSVFLTFVLSGAVRHARSGESLEENLKNFVGYFSNIGNMNFISLMWGFSDFTQPFSTFITLIKNVPQNIDYNYSLLMNDFSLLIPTIVYPQRPLPVSMWFVKTFEPQIFAAGGGLTFYAIGTGYLFAGALGIIVLFFLWGAIFELIKKFFEMIGEPASVFLYSFFFIDLFIFVRSGEIFSFLKNSLILHIFIPLFFFFLFIYLLESLKKRILYQR